MGIVLEEFHSENNEAFAEETAIMVKLLQRLLMVFMTKDIRKDR